MAKTQKEYKIDLFNDLLPAIDKCDYGWYERQNDEIKKEFQPFVIMRWISGTANSSGCADYFIRATNEIVNRDFFALQKHPELQYKLLASVGLGQKQRHVFVPMPKGKTKENKFVSLLKRKHGEINEQEIRILIRNFDMSKAQDLCKDFAIDDKETKQILKEFKLLVTGK